MEIEALVARVTAPEPRCLGLLRRMSTPADARAGSGAERYPTMDGRRRDSGQHRRVRRPLVQRTATRVRVLYHAA